MPLPAQQMMKTFNQTHGQCHNHLFEQQNCLLLKPLVISGLASPSNDQVFLVHASLVEIFQVFLARVRLRLKNILSDSESKFFDHPYT